MPNGLASTSPNVEKLGAFLMAAKSQSFKSSQGIFADVSVALHLRYARSFFIYFSQVR